MLMNHFVLDNFFSTATIIIISTGCGVVCTAAVLITMVTTCVHLKKKKRRGYDDGMRDGH